MVNNLVRKTNPSILGDDLHQVAFDFHRFGFSREIEPLGDSLHVRIDDDTGGDTKRRAEHDIRRLASRARHFEEIVDILRNLAAEVSQDRLRRADHRLGFVVEESRRVYILRQHFLPNGGKVLNGWILREQAGCYLVDTLVRALRGEDRGDQKFPRIRMMKRARNVRKHAVQSGEDSSNSSLSIGGGLGPDRDARGLPIGRRDGFLGSTRRSQSTSIALIAVAAFAAFGAAPWGTFHLDDYSLFTENAPPLRWLTWLTYRLNGTDAWGFLAVNLGLHVANAILVFILLGRMAPALLFAVHPLCAEPVNYVFARPTLLAAIFSLGVFLAWKHDRRWLALGLLGLALAAKEDALAVPLVLLLFDRKLSKPLVAMLALCAVSGVWSVYAVATTPGSGAGAQSGVAPLDYFLSQGAVIWRYLRTFVVPWGLTLDPTIDTRLGWLGWIALAGLAAVWRSRYVWVAILLMLPSSSIVPLADMAADRRMYLSVAALAAALPPLSVWIVPVLAVLSVRQTQFWRTEESLWRYVVAESPDRLRPKIQLSRAVPPQECRTILEPTEKRWPEDPRIPSELGRCALQKGDAATALRHFGRALALSPNDPAAIENRDAALRVLTGK